MNPARSKSRFTRDAIPEHELNKKVPSVSSLSCWCSVGNAGMNLGIPLQETRRLVAGVILSFPEHQQVVRCPCSEQCPQQRLVAGSAWHCSATAETARRKVARRKVAPAPEAKSDSIQCGKSEYLVCLKIGLPFLNGVKRKTGN